MNNFYLNTPGSVCFSGAQFVAGWQAGISNSQRAGAQVQNLWHAFNEGRATLDKHYMDNRASLDAYLASFLLPNCERVFTVLTSSQGQAKLLQILQNRTTPLRVLDFGCGPLSATAGFLAACEYTLEKANIKKAPLFEICGVERSEKAFTAGRALIDRALTHPESVTFELKTSIEKAAGEFDVILCANVFNELPEKHRQSTAQKVAQKLVPGGLLLMLEPGQDVHSKALGMLRDNLLETSAPLRVVAPCTHNGPCPLSARSNRPDWCWFQTRWEMPEALAQIDKFSKLDHSELNFSFVLFCKEQATASAAFARVVSAPINVTPAAPENFARTAIYAENNPAPGCDVALLKKLFDAQKPLSKIILCTQNATLESGFTTVDDMEWNRGAILTKEYDLKTRVQERFALDKEAASKAQNLPEKAPQTKP